MLSTTPSIAPKQKDEHIVSPMQQHKMFGAQSSSFGTTIVSAEVSMSFFNHCHWTTLVCWHWQKHGTILNSWHCIVDSQN